MFDGNMFFPPTGTPMSKMARIKIRFADWLPVPFDVATVMTRSLTMGCICPTTYHFSEDARRGRQGAKLKVSAARSGGGGVPMVHASNPPESGFRIEVERDRAGEGPPWRYEGVAVTPSMEYGVAAVVEESGEVHVEVAGDAPSRMVRGVATMVRTACGRTVTPDSEPPMRIVRWRAER
jgi:hypothetical protein